MILGMNINFIIFEHTHTHTLTHVHPPQYPHTQIKGNNHLKKKQFRFCSHNKFPFLYIMLCNTVQRTLEMAGLPSLLLLAFLASSASGSNLFDINIHNCKFQDGIMDCSFKGQGLYKPDRPMVGVSILRFDRFGGDLSSIDVKNNAPDLELLIIQDGDVECTSIRANAIVIRLPQGKTCSVSLNTSLNTLYKQTQISTTSPL